MMRFKASKVDCQNKTFGGKKVALIPSILGLDFLNRYRLTLQNSYIVLKNNKTSPDN